MIEYKAKEKMNYNFYEIRKMREEAGLSQAQLSEKSGVSKKQIINIEKGKVEKVRNSTLEELAKALCKGNEDYFFDRIGEKFETEKRFLEHRSIAKPVKKTLERLINSSENGVSAFLSEYSDFFKNMTDEEIELVLTSFCGALLACQELTGYLLDIDRCWHENIRLLEMINNDDARKVLSEMKNTWHDNNFSKKLRALKNCIVFCENNFDKYPKEITGILSNAAKALNNATVTPDQKKDLFYKSVTACERVVERRYGILFKEQDPTSYEKERRAALNIEEHTVPPRKPEARSRGSRGVSRSETGAPCKISERSERYHPLPAGSGAAGG